MTTKAAILHVIREKCLDCSCHQPSEVRACTATACPLWPFRLGVDPQPSSNRGFANPDVYAARFADGCSSPGAREQP